jgi:predicted kinase
MCQSVSDGEEMKKVIIMCGVSGSGKSTYIQNNHMVCRVVSADTYFMKSGKYVFDVMQLGEAHSECLRNFIELCQNGEDKIIVDNTNTTIEEIAPYYAIAKAYGYEVELVKMNIEIEIAANRNLHGVPYLSIRAMDNRIREMKTPRYWDIKCVNVCQQGK